MSLGQSLKLAHLYARSRPYEVAEYAKNWLHHAAVASASEDVARASDRRKELLAAAAPPLLSSGRVGMDGARWVADRLGKVPPRWAKSLRKIHDQKGGIFAQPANEWLRESTEEIAGYRLDLSATDGDICATAKRAARECFEVAAGAGLSFDKQRLIYRMSEYCARWKVSPPDQEKFTQAGMIGRMTDEQWWRRQLRKLHGRGLEGWAIRLGFVHRRAGMYCSEETLQNRQQQKKRNAATLKTVELENEFGQSFTLEQLAALSVANPAIKRGELMCRIAGFEACAKAAGHVGEFVTLTCPSAYHARISGSGEENPKYAGATPREAQAYLQGVWAKIRASMARQGVRLYGFRIAEPHHDGCPHWHMLFFMAAEAVEKFRAVMTKYALQVDPDEAGARSNRVKFVSIDWQRNGGTGSAAGYIAKYIAKNVDGENVGLDLEGNPAIESAMRVDAWASRWGIRQFQQVGGPPVGVWRELRRIAEGVTPAMERCRSAADVGNWQAYVMAMGGPTAKRIHHPVSVAKRQREERNRYGEEGAWSPYGVMDVNEGVVSESRRFQWRIKGGARGVAFDSP